MKIRYYIALMLCILGSASFYSIRQIQKPKRAKNSLVIGTAAGYAPFVSINQQGHYEGFDIDIAQELGKRMEKEVIIKDLGSMTPLFLALEQGSIDAIIWGLSITADRCKNVTMVRYQGETTRAYSLIFWKENPSFTSLERAEKLIICVEPASSQEAVLQNYANLTCIPAEKVDDALLMIQYGKADAAFVEPAIAAKFKKAYPHLTVIDVPLTPDQQVYGIGIALKKNNRDLKDACEKAVSALEQEGIIATLEKKWRIS